MFTFILELFGFVEVGVLEIEVSIFLIAQNVVTIVYLNSYDYI